MVIVPSIRAISNPSSPIFFQSFFFFFFFWSTIIHFQDICNFYFPIGRGRNSVSPVARGYQILLWATRKKTSFSPLGYQTLWLYGRENQQSAVRICSNTYCPAVPVCQIGTPYRLLLWTLIKNFVQNV